MKLRTLSTAALAACSLVLSGAIPASAAVPAGASPSSGAFSSAAGAVTGDGFVRSLGTASALVPRATGYDAVDPAQGYGTITGRVTAPAGVSLGYVEVTLTDGEGNRADSAYVRDGLFGVTSLDAGTYTLTAQGESKDGQGLSGGPLQASVTLGMLTSGVVIPLRAGAPSSLGSIEGTVTGPGGTALPAGTWGDIDAYDSSGDWAGDGDLGEGGTFQVRGLDPGAYRLRIVVDGFADEWWQDKASLGTATPVTVTSGAVTSINPQVDVGGAIAGTVTGPGGITLPDGFWVRAYDEDGDGVGWSSGNGTTYQIGGLAAGKYTVQFGTDDGVYATEWWDNVESADVAAPVTVIDGQTIGGTDAELAVRPIQGGKITGTITGPGGAALAAGTTGEVAVYDSAGENADWASFTASGTFEVKGLEPGDYRVRLYTDSSSGYAREWWQDKATLESATPVSVTPGGTTNLTPQLNLAGSIAGTVTGPNGAALAPDTEGYVSVYTSDGDGVADGEFTADGQYQVSGLSAGVDYFIKFYVWSGGYLSEWWQDAATQAEATPVTVESGGQTQINPELDLAGSIAGTVTGLGGGPLLAGTSGFIRAYDSNGDSVGYGYFDADPQAGSGAYQIDGLSRGAYKLRVISESYRYRTQWWNLDLSSAAADPVNVALGQTTGGINPALQSTSSAPGVPTGLTGSAGDGQVSLTWAAPASDGGEPISDYDVQSSSNGGSTWQTFAHTASTATSIVVTGLGNGTGYVFRVAARNSVGAGAFTAAAGPIAPVAPQPPVVPPVVQPPVVPPVVQPPVVPPVVQPPVVPPPVVEPPAPPASVVKVKAVKRANKLFVNVNPNKGKGYWKFKIQKKKKNGSWRTYKKKYKTFGKKETRTINRKKGTYRVVVLPKYGLASSTSAEVRLRR